MASLLIKDLPPELHERLREAARRNHRSMAKQVIAMLEDALVSRPAALPQPLKGTFPLRQEWLDSVIREGRP
jgi:plasmid stability protein